MADSAIDSPRDRVRACAYCNKSKTKCMWMGEPGESACQRCIRLNRSCVVSEKRERRKRGPSTRMGQLEEKVEGIMTLLNASPQIQQTGTSPVSQPQKGPQPRSQSQSESLASATPLSYEYETPREGVGPSISRIPTGALPLPSAEVPMDYIIIVPGFSLSFDEAERALNLYQTSYSPHSPFVPISTEATFWSMNDSQPFLLRTILQAVAPQNAAIQRDVNHWFRECIAQHVVVNQEKRLELLQAILIYIAWGDFHFYVESQATNLLQLAISLVVELGLNRPPKTPGHIPNNLVDNACRFKGLGARPPQTLADMRAFLGTFYLASTAAVLFRRLPLFPYTNYIAHCCEQLQAQKEYESDDLLISLVHMQRLACRIYTAFPNPELDNSGPSDFYTPLYMTMSTIRNDIDALKNQAPLEVQGSAVFNVCYLGTLVRLYEPVIYTRSSHDSKHFTDASQRTETLWRGLETAKTFLNVYTTIPVDTVPYLPLPILSYFTFGLITSTRLLFLADSDWDLQLARKFFDLAELTERLSAVFGEADRVAISEEWRKKRKFIDDTRSMMAMHRDKLRWIASSYTARLEPADKSRQQPLASNPDVMELSPSDTMGLGGCNASLWQAILDGSRSGEVVQP